MSPLSDKVALVTGASAPKGIGEAIAKRFAAAGASLFLVAEGTVAQLETLTQECRRLSTKGGRVEYGVFDLAETGAAEAMVEEALAVFGRVDILVNNAGIRVPSEFGGYSREDFDRAVAVNLASPLFASQAVLPAMRRQGGGRIIHIASQMGMVAFDRRMVYGMTKAALIYLAKAMAYEVAADGIVVNAISPGPTLTQPNIDRVENEPEHAQSRLAYIRANRYGTPEEVAEVAFFLASTDATFLQGDNIVMDGGYTTH